MQYGVLTCAFSSGVPMKLRGSSRGSADVGVETSDKPSIRNCLAVTGILSSLPLRLGWDEVGKDERGRQTLPELFTTPWRESKSLPRKVLPRPPLDGRANMGIFFSREDTALICHSCPPPYQNFNSWRKLQKHKLLVHGRNHQSRRKSSAHNVTDRPKDVSQKSPPAQSEGHTGTSLPVESTSPHHISDGWDGYAIPRPPARLGYRRQDEHPTSDELIGVHINNLRLRSSGSLGNYVEIPSNIPKATAGPSTHAGPYEQESDDQRRKRRRRERRRSLRRGESRGRSHPDEDESSRQIISDTETNAPVEDNVRPQPQKWPRSPRSEGMVREARCESSGQGLGRISSHNSIRSSRPLSSVQSMLNAFHQELHESRSTLSSGANWQKSAKLRSHTTAASSKVSITRSETTGVQSPASTIRPDRPPKSRSWFFARSRSRSRDRPPLSPSGPYRPTSSLGSPPNGSSIDSNVLDQRLRAISAAGKTRRRSSTSARNTYHARSSVGGGFGTTTGSSSRRSSLICTPSQVSTPRISSSQVSDEDEDAVQMLLKDMTKLLKQPMDEMKRHPDKRRIQKLSRLAGRVHDDVRTAGAGAPTTGYAELLTLYMNMKMVFKKSIAYPQEQYLWAQGQIDSFTVELEQWFADSKAARSPAAVAISSASGAQPEISSPNHGSGDAPATTGIKNHGAAMTQLPDALTPVSDAWTYPRQSKRSWQIGVNSWGHE